MYEKGQYIVYGIRGVCQVADIITIDHPVGPKGVFIMNFILIIRRMEDRHTGRLGEDHYKAVAYQTGGRGADPRDPSDQRNDRGK